MTNKMTTIEIHNHAFLELLATFIALVQNMSTL